MVVSRHLVILVSLCVPLWRADTKIFTKLCKLCILISHAILGFDLRCFVSNVYNDGFLHFLFKIQIY